MNREMLGYHMNSSKLRSKVGLISKTFNIQYIPHSYYHYHGPNEIILSC